MMSPSWSKVFRDFWRERARTSLVAFTIAIGIAAFSSVLASYAILTRELNLGWLETNPASATIRTDRVDDALVAEIAAQPGVAQVEARRTLTGMIKTGPVEWRNLVLFVVRDFEHVSVSTLKPQEGAWPPAEGEILIERDAVRVAKARMGDMVTIKTGGKERTLRFGGSVKDVGQAQARMENIVYGYITRDTLARLGAEPFFNQVKLVVSGDRLDANRIKQVTAEVQRFLENRGHPVSGIEIPAPGKHPHADLMGLFLLVMASFGLFALLLSSILVVNLMTALMGAQIRQIGVMKTLGATRWQVARIYFAQALLLGVAAILVGLPTGLFASRWLCRYFAVFLNFDVTSFAVPWWVFPPVLAVGALVPLLSSAFPVWNGCGVSVRVALDDFEVSRRKFGETAFDRMLTGFGGLTRPVLLAVRNGFRRRLRTALTALTMTLAGLSFLAALNVRTSLINTFDHLFDAMNHDLAVNLGGLHPMEKAAQAALQTRGVTKAEGWLVTDGAVSGTEKPPAKPGGVTVRTEDEGNSAHGENHAETRRFRTIGIPPETNLFNPYLLAGRRLQPGDTDALVMNTRLAALLPGVKVGDTIRLNIGKTTGVWRVVGLAREPFAGPTAYVPLGFFEGTEFKGMTNSLRLVLEPTSSTGLDQLKANLDRNLEAASIRAVGLTGKSDLRYAADQHMVMIYIFLLVVAGILAGVGGLGLATTMSLNVTERRREMGVLRAIGATPSNIWLIVTLEAVMTCLMSWTLACIFAWPISRGLGEMLLRMMFKIGLDFRFDFSGPAVWLALSVAIGVAASFLPAWRAARRPIREAVEYE